MEKQHDTATAQKSNGNARRVPPSVPIDDYFARQMQDPEFAKAYEELAPEFELVSQIIAMRLKRKLSQRQLAERMGTPQPSIARMESTRAIKNLDYVRRVAEALGCTLEVRFVPKKNGGKSENRRTGFIRCGGFLVPFAIEVHHRVRVPRLCCHARSFALSR
jgi:ribosome-binding protein aMBF1 (putative translation factor)